MVSKDLGCGTNPSSLDLQCCIWTRLTYTRWLVKTWPRIPTVEMYSFTPVPERVCCYVRS